MAIEKAEFEKRFLTLVYQTDVVITAPNIAYHLDLPIEEVQEHLLALELNGTIQQSVDNQGNSFYLMPNRPPPGTLPAQLNDSSNQGGQSNGRPPGVFNPANTPAAPIYANPPAKARNVNGLVLNIIFPGIGSLVCGHKEGGAMLGLVILGLFLFFLPFGWGRLWGILPILVGWIWSIIAGVGLLSEKEPHPGIPSS